MSHQARFAGAALMLVVGGVHLQQYLDFMSEVKTIGVLFLLNAAGAAGIAVWLASREVLLRKLAALGGIALSAGSLVCIVLSAGGGVFGYQEPTWRTSMVIAVVAEAAAILALAAYLAVSRPSGTPAAPA